jgi:hypothetical protein
MPTNDILFEGAYHYGRRQIAVLGSLLVLICGFFLIRMVWAQVADSSFSLSMDVLGLMFMLAAFAFTGGLLLFYFLSNKVLHLTIDHLGVRYGTYFFPWEKVHSLRGSISVSRCQIRLSSRGWLRLNRCLVIDVGLTPPEFEALMQKLQDMVAPHFDHLQFVGQPLVID